MRGRGGSGAQMYTKMYTRVKKNVHNYVKKYVHMSGFKNLDICTFFSKNVHMYRMYKKTLVQKFNNHPTHFLG